MPSGPPRRSPAPAADPQLSPPVHVGGVVYQQRMVRCGSDACRKCVGGRYAHGPYWYAFWGEKGTGRTRTKYIGRELPPELLKAQAMSVAVRASVRAAK
jgi:hypothetical protein